MASLPYDALPFLAQCNSHISVCLLQVKNTTDSNNVGIASYLPRTRREYGVMGSTIDEIMM